MGLRFRAFEIPTFKRMGRGRRGGGGGGGRARNGKDRVFVFKTLWKRSLNWVQLRDLFQLSSVWACDSAQSRYQH